MDVARDASNARPSRLDGVEFGDLAFTVNFDVARLAVSSGVTVRQLERHFRKRFGLTPHEFMARQRLAKAKELLGTGEPVKAVCFALSFKQPSYFTRAYIRFYGYAPKHDRQRRV